MSALKLRPFAPPVGKLSVVVPVFNEYANIAANLDLLIDEIEEHFAEFEIIVVSDGSTDGTAETLYSFRHPTVRPLVLTKNEGKGSAVRAGLKRATGRYILFIDGGMEIHPREVRIFVGLLSLYDADVVIGSKRHPQSDVFYPWYRRGLSWMFQRLVHVLFDLDVTDTQVGIKLFRREVIDAILPDLQIDRYGFDLELLSLARLKGFGKILEAPVRLDYFGRQNRFVITDLAHVVRVGISLLSDTYRLYRRVRRLRRHPADDAR